MTTIDDVNGAVADGRDDDKTAADEVYERRTKRSAIGADSSSSMVLCFVRIDGSFFFPSVQEIADGDVERGGVVEDGHSDFYTVLSSIRTNLEQLADNCCSIHGKRDVGEFGPKPAECER